jgi:hypothetical protein
MRDVLIESLLALDEECEGQKQEMVRAILRGCEIDLDEYELLNSYHDDGSE